MTRSATNTKSVWDEQWTQIKDTVREHDVYYLMDQTKLRYLLKSAPRTGRSLEVGCGSAHLSAFLAQRGFETHGIDYAPEATRVARANYAYLALNGSFYIGDAECLPFRDASFDLVLSTGLLEHFENPLPILHEMVRVLRPGGTFYSDIVPDKFSSFRAFDGLRLRKWNMFEAKWNRARIWNFLEMIGLEKIQVFGAGVLPPLWFPVLSHFQTYYRIYNSAVRVLLPLLTRLDGTFWGERLGFYYFCVGVRRV